VADGRKSQSQNGKTATTTYRQGESQERVVKVDSEGKVFINATFNNIIITFTNMNGQAISWSSAGKWDSVVLRRTLRMQHSSHQGKPLR
jgi:ribosomal protein S11